MNAILTLLLLILVNVAYSSQIECKPGKAGKTINVTMEVPHPKNALIYRPTGTAVYLKLTKFESVAKLEINRELEGEVWIEGKAKIEKVIKKKGVYRLYIADNLETEPLNTSYIECKFEIK